MTSEVTAKGRELHLAGEAIVIAINELDNTIIYDLTIICEWKENGPVELCGPLRSSDRDYLGKYEVVDARELAWTPDVIFFHEKEKNSTETTYYRDMLLGASSVSIVGI